MVLRAFLAPVDAALAAFAVFLEGAAALAIWDAEEEEEECERRGES